MAWVRASVCLGAGRLDEAAGHAARSLRLMDDVGDRAFERHVRHVLAEVALLRGDREQARTQLSAVEARGETLPVARALLTDAEGGPRGAAALVRLLGAPASEATGWVPWPDQLLVQAACSARRADDTALLRAAGERLAELAAGAPAAAGLQAAALIAGGRTARDLGTAVEMLRPTPRKLLLAHALEEFGRRELADGDRQTAVAALDEARDVFAEVGASSAASRVQRILQAAGVRRRRWPAAQERPAGGWEALTEMERRVALLVADGHSNRSAAAELVLAPSTVSTHLQAAFSKLDVHSRVQLAKLVLRRGTEGFGTEHPRAEHPGAEGLGAEGPGAGPPAPR
ncbi:regulatory protein, luxR family [Streptomyces sp. DvalAA-14]|uniref:helix-turn-helix transcriptional regulator n=1 Tax=unclassified Streptomyces TaxID=2593676 RepID=UPI00081AEDDC|nr:LuxR C-terminal-related transcriptional regulator [Streptomyces sp. DvalAA-14]SCD60520.1 regulatory protein, luxR family [Streptomyces sp. DvalAA-14]